MKKNALKSLLIAITILFFGFESPANSYANGINLWIDGKYITGDKPVIESGRTLVPLRVISETLGYEVTWEAEVKMVLISNLENIDIDDSGKLTIDPVVMGIFTDLPAALVLNKNAYQEEIDKVIANPNYEPFSDYPGMVDMQAYGEKWLNEMMERTKNVKITGEIETMKLLVDDFNKNFKAPMTMQVLDVKPRIINGRTYVPLRFIAELTGKKVDWDSKNKTAIVGDGYVAQ